MGLTRKQFAVLDTLHSHGGALFDSGGFAATRLFALIKGSYDMIKWGAGLTNMLASLEADGYVEREIVGKRTHNIKLTAEGRKVLRQSDRLTSNGDSYKQLSAEIKIESDIQVKISEGWTLEVLGASDAHELLLLKAPVEKLSTRETQIRDILKSVATGKVNTIQALQRIDEILE